MSSTKKNIVIIGGGLCGLKVATELSKKLKQTPETSKHYRLIVVNETNVHVYHSDLYEIASAYNEKITQACLTALEDSVCIKITDVAKKSGFTFYRDRVTAIDTDKKTITLKKRETLDYEYLVVAVGSVTNYYNIPGIEDHSFPLKELTDALTINCHLDQLFQERAEKKTDEKVCIAIGGGGATGIEFSCELIGFLNKLSKKYSFSRKDVDLSIIDGGYEFLKLGKKPNQIVKKRLKKLGIKPMQGTYIKGYENGNLILEDKKTKETSTQKNDVLIWTGGIKANPLLQSFSKLNKYRELDVNEMLECTAYPNIFAGGDNATITHPKTGEFIPKTGQFAAQEGKIIAYNIWADINKQYKKQFKPFLKGYLVPLGGKRYMFIRGNIVFSGIIPFLMKKVLDIMYFNWYMPLTTAVTRIFTKEKIFVQND